MNTIELIKNYDFNKSVKTFISNIDGELWYDIPFLNPDFKKRD